MPDSGTAVANAARDVLAWEDINGDDDTVGQLEDSQKRALTESLKRAKADLKESIWRAYRHVFLLNKTNAIKDNDLGQINSSMAPTLPDLIVNSCLWCGISSYLSITTHHMVPDLLDILDFGSNNELYIPVIQAMNSSGSVRRHLYPEELLQYQRGGSTRNSKFVVEKDDDSLSCSSIDSTPSVCSRPCARLV